MTVDDGEDRQYAPSPAAVTITVTDVPDGRGPVSAGPADGGVGPGYDDGTDTDESTTSLKVSLAPAR